MSNSRELVKLERKIAEGISDCINYEITKKKNREKKRRYYFVKSREREKCLKVKRENRNKRIRR